jgi:hypothetical protein
MNRKDYRNAARAMYLRPMRKTAQRPHPAGIAATIDFLLSAKRDAAAAEESLGRGRTIPCRGHQYRRSTPLIHPPSLNSKPAVFWKRREKREERRVFIDRCSILIMFWNRITGPSNAGCVQASIFAPFWVLGNSGSICRAGAGNRSAFLGAKARFSLIYLTLETISVPPWCSNTRRNSRQARHCDILEVWAGPV